MTVLGHVPGVSVPSGLTTSWACYLPASQLGPRGLGMRLPGLAWGAGQEEVTSQLAHEGREGVRHWRRERKTFQGTETAPAKHGRQKKKRHSRFQRAK